MLEKKDFSRETLLKCLKRLKLNGLNAVLNQVLDEAKGSRLTPTETLAYALGLEVQCREEKRIQLGLTLAHFPRFWLRIAGRSGLMRFV